jgi:N-acetylglucosamine kinase-like BadF-type ATPase
MSRSKLAALTPVVAQAARAGDTSARRLFALAAEHLASIVHAVHDQLNVPPGTIVPVSYSGGMFKLNELVKSPLEAVLGAGDRHYRFLAPRLPPVAGAALYAARLAGAPLEPDSVAALERKSIKDLA